MSRSLFPSLFVCALMVLSVPTAAQTTHAQATAINQADDEEARDLFQIGKDAFDEGRFERALKYFKESYDLSHRAALLSNIGTVLDRLRRDREALDAYRLYLEQVPEAPNRRQVEERMRIIESALARSQPAPPAAEAAPQLTAAEPASKAQEPLVPTPAETARASASLTSTSDAQHPRDSGTASISSRWWFWTGIGAVAVAALVVVVAVSAGGGEAGPAQPTLLDPRTRVREL